LTEITRDDEEDEDVGRLSWNCAVGLVTGFSGVVIVVAVGGRDKLEDREMVATVKQVPSGAYN